jgi:DNA invertase Pin-like site-specific DNA recombinase
MPTMTDVRREHAKIVEILDAKGASFVSVTQQFNTTTSMGRLTLNVLLSFAQFEREVTGERIRDKIAASKKKGMWFDAFLTVDRLSLTSAQNGRRLSPPWRFPESQSPVRQAGLFFS